MKLIVVPLCALIVTPCFSAQAHRLGGQAEERSVRRFVQGFYDWYVALKDGRESPLEVAVKRRRSDFGPALWRALREDLAAQAKSPGEVVGLDWDPFLASQDPDPHYSVGAIKHKGGIYFVSVRGVAAGKPPGETVVIPKVEKHQGSWKFTNFLYPKSDDLLDTLRLLRQDRMPHRPGKPTAGSVHG